ncbi:MAG TPA: hypothetical protein ENG20_01590 [Methanomicrobia archaeon]|nr:hypothetical protein [Methanomicrobia archaeon]
MIENGTKYHFSYLRNRIPLIIEKIPQIGIKIKINKTIPVYPKTAYTSKKQTVETIQIKCLFTCGESFFLFIQSPEFKFLENRGDSIHRYSYTYSS